MHLQIPQTWPLARTGVAYKQLDANRQAVAAALPVQHEKGPGPVIRVLKPPADVHRYEKGLYVDLYA